MISDPGRYLVNEAIDEGIEIVPIPGATSVITALSISGFNIDNFKYFGFLPRKKNEREVLIKEICTSGITSVVFESGKRLGKLIDEISKELQDDVQLLVAREMTKIHETFYRGSLASLIENFVNINLKGEFVILIGKDKDSVYF